MADIVLTGDTSGAITVAAPAVAGTNTLTLPANTGTLMTSTYTSGDVDIDSGTLHVDATNNRVGIGTSSPAHNVEIVATASGSVNDTLQIRNNATDTGTGSRIRFINSTDVNSDANGASIASIRTGGDNDLAFETENVEHMRIASDGKVSVGTTDTGFASGVGVKIRPGLDGSIATVDSASTSASTSLIMYSTGASAYRFYVSWAGTIYATSTSITGISDERLKENIVDLDEGLDTVMSLKPRKFDWKNGKGKNIKGDRGFIAQEFETVLPDLTEELKDEVPEGEAPYKGVNLNLTPILVKAIQELKAENDTLKSQLSALETRIQALENA
nr:cell wall surface anchor family protein [uncultured bacterium]